MVMGYWSVATLFWQLSIDHIVNVLKSYIKRCGLAKTRLRHPSLLFDSLPYPTRAICRRVRTYVRTYVRSVNHVTTKRKEVDHIPRVWGSVPRALRARGSPAKIIFWLKSKEERRDQTGSYYTMLSTTLLLSWVVEAPVSLSIRNSSQS